MRDSSVYQVSETRVRAVSPVSLVALISGAACSFSARLVTRATIDEHMKESPAQEPAKNTARSNRGV